jgi:hypothetical protein
MEEPVQENEGSTADALLGDALDGTSVGVRRDIVLDFAIALRPECRERSE